MGKPAHGQIVPTDARIFRYSITLVALDAAQYEDFDETTLVEVSRIAAEVLSFESEELFLIEPVCATCMDDDEITQRDILLAALDKLVTAQLGDKWTLDDHMALKHKMLETIDKEEETHRG